MSAEFAKAVVIANSLDDAVGPMQQILCIERTLHAVVAAVEACQQANATASGASTVAVCVLPPSPPLSLFVYLSIALYLALSDVFCSGADDLVPLFIYVLVRSRPQHLASIALVAQSWADERGVALGQLGWCLATLQTAVEFLFKTSVEDLLHGRRLVSQALSPTLSPQPRR